MTLVVNITDVNDKIYDAARQRGVPSAQLAREMTAHYLADTERLGLGRPDRRAAGLGDHRADRRSDRGAAGARACLCGGRRRLLPGPLVPGLRRALPSRRRPDGPGRGRRGRGPQGGPARLRAVEGAQGGRGHRLGRSLGPGTPGLAHRVLGDGRGDPGRRLRHPRRRDRPDLPPPRERGRPDPGGARRAAGPDLDAQRDARARRREDVQVGGQHPLPGRRAGPRRPPRRSSSSSATATTASRSPTARSCSTRPCAARHASARPPAAWSPAPARPRWLRCASSSWPRWRTTSTPRTALAAVAEWVREANRRSEPVGDADLREMLGLLGVESLLDAPAASPSPSPRWPPWPRSARRRARARDFARADALREAAARARLGRARRARGAGARARGVIVYGRNAVREALRGPRRVERVWATRRAARGRLARAAQTSRSWARRRRSSAAAARRATRASAPRWPATATPTPTRCWAPRSRCSLALDGVEDPQNLGAICRTAESAGATGVVLPERRSAEVTPAVCKASAGAVEHLAIARVRNLADFLRDAKERGLLGLRSRRRRGARLRRAGLHRGRGGGPRGRGAGPAPARGGRLRRAGGGAHARTRRVPQRERRGGRSAVRDLAAARPRS